MSTPSSNAIDSYHNNVYFSVHPKAALIFKIPLENATSNIKTLRIKTQIKKILAFLKPKGWMMSGYHAQLCYQDEKFPQAHFSYFFRHLGTKILFTMAQQVELPPWNGVKASRVPIAVQLLYLWKSSPNAPEKQQMMAQYLNLYYPNRRPGALPLGFNLALVQLLWSSGK